MSNLQTNVHLKTNFQKEDQHTGGMRLIHDTRHCKAIICKSWSTPVEYPAW